MARLLPVCALAAALVTACASQSAREATDGSAVERAVQPAATLQPVPAATRAPYWQVGAHALALRADGFGRVQRTPKVLRVRDLPTVDRLPPPPGGRWTSSIRAIDGEIRARMGRTWHRSCPVDLTHLRYLTVAFRGFDGAAHTGELIVHRRAARDMVAVFRTLFRADFPIESMRIVTSADLDAPPTGDDNNTAAFVCRAVRAQTNWSAHAYGLAIDINPFQNPYTRRDLVLPELASAYLNRTWQRPGMIHRRDLVTRAFAAIGWSWGGDWTSTIDRMHFSALGR